MLPWPKNSPRSADAQSSSGDFKAIALFGYGFDSFFGVKCAVGQNINNTIRLIFFPRPTLAAQLMQLLSKPKRLCVSISIQEALATSTPTSRTVVGTKNIQFAPSKNDCIKRLYFGFFIILP